MLFNSLQYLIFLPVVLAIYWLSPARWRSPILLAASYIFYMVWRPIYIFLILSLTVISYWFGLKIHASKRHKKAWMVAAVAANLLALAYFKYFYFLEDMIGWLARPWFGQLEKIPINIILPLGISFFVFEFIHYLADVYRGGQPVRNFISFALFPSFFPTQIAGPIKRYQDFVPQLDVAKKLSRTDFDEGAFLILSGLFKKVLLADNLSLFVAAGFAKPSAFTGVDMWLFAFAFAFQVYFDFGGYVDIARGSAKLLGFSVPINFDFPYLAGNISEFWRRWNITLGTWLRDYLFIPLGGSRGSRFAVARNLIITMTLGGLWHGAEFHYVIWGLYYGVLLAAHREFKLFRQAYPRLLSFLDTRPGHILAIAVTFMSTTIGSAIFRSETTAAAGVVLSKMFFLDGLAEAQRGISAVLTINHPLIFPSIFLLLPAFFIGQVLINWLAKTGKIQTSPRLLKVACAVTVMFCLCAFAPDKSPRFIYFQF